MARRLREILVPLTLDPEDLRIREGLNAPPARPSASAVAWLLRGSGGGADPARSTWADRWGVEHLAKVQVARTSAGYVLDADAAGPRVTRTARLVAAGVRAWSRIEFLELVPEDTAIGYRLHNGTAELFWNGAAWAASAGDATGWNTPEEINAHLATLPATSRTIAIVARLSTTSAEASPAFYGARVAFLAVERSDEEDATHRALLETLREELTIPGLQETALPSGLAAAARLELFPGQALDVVSVDAAFDLTADPNELAPLAGTLTPFVFGTPGTSATWAPTLAIAAGHVLRLEVSVRPDAVIAAHHEIAQVARLPAVRIYPGAVLERLHAPEPEPLRGSTWAGGASQPGGSERVTALLSVIAIAELGTQARALAEALGDFLGSAGYRSLVSRETGRIVTIRTGEAFASDPAPLAEGVTEIRGSWVLEYEHRRGRTFSQAFTVRPGGATLTETTP